MEDKQLPVASMSSKDTSNSLEGADVNTSVASYSIGQKNYPIESLEVHGEGGGTVVSSGADTNNQYASNPALRSLPVSRRKAALISVGITFLVVLLTGVAVAYVVRKNTANDSAVERNVPTQDVSLQNPIEDTTPVGLEEGESLLVNGDLITEGVLKVVSGDFVNILTSEPLTANRTFTLPDASGTVCLDVNNCNYATEADSAAQAAQITALQNQFTQLDIPDPFTGVTSLNGQNGVVSVQGSTNRISVSTSNGIITITTPQDLDANANVQFGSLTVDASGSIVSNSLTHTGNGNDIVIDAGNDGIIFVDAGRTFQFPAGGPGTQTVCTTQGNCGGGGATPVILAPGTAQNEATADASIFIDDTGGGNLIQLQTSGVDQLVVTDTGDTSIGGSLTVGSLGSGVVRATGGLLSVGSVSLTTEVTGTLPVANGGTGAASLTANGVLLGNGTSAITSVVSGGAGLCFMSNVGAPSWQACPGGGGVTTLNSMTGAIDIQGTTNQINVANGVGTITLSTPQDIATTSNVQFNNLNLTGQADIVGHSAIGDNAAVSATTALVVDEVYTSSCAFNCGAIEARATIQANSNQISGITTQVIADGTGIIGGAGIVVNGNSTINGGSISSNYGVYIASQTAGGSDYGVYVQAADTYAFWADAGLSRFDGGVEIQGGSPIVLEGTTDDGFETTIAVTDPTADRTITLPNLSGTVCLDSGNCIGSGGGAPNSANYLLTTLDPTLTNDRALTAGSNIAFTDGGANGNFTVATVMNPNFTTSVTSPLLTSTGVLTVTPGGAMTLGATGQTALLQGSTTTITSTGAGNDITLTSADQIILNGVTDINNYAAIGNSAGPQSLAALSLGHSFNGVNCATFGCHGILGSIDATNVTGVNPGLTSFYSGITVSAGSLFQTAGFYASNPSGAGTITDNYGVLVASQTKGTNDYGVYIQGADTYALWVDSGISRFDGNLEFEGSTDDAFEFTLAVADPTADRTYTIPNSSSGTDTFCLVNLGNCAGSGGGVTGSGTTNRVAKFTSSGVIGDSTISDDGTDVSLTGDITIQGGQINLGTTSTAGSIVLSDGSSNTLTLDIGALGGNRVYTFPDVGGNADVCLSTGNCIGGGGGGAPNNAQYLTLALDSNLSAERVLTAGTNMSFTDGGANGSLTVATVNNPTFSTSVTTPILQGAGLTVAATGANAITFETNGSTRATIQSNGNTVFDTNTLSVDAVNNRVGIGTTAPAAALEVTGDVYLTKEGDRTIKLADSTTAATAGAHLNIVGANGNGADGGDITVKAGDAGGVNAAGDITIAGGDSFGSGGNITIRGGEGGVDGGTVTIRGGLVGADISGDILIQSDLRVGVFSNIDATSDIAGATAYAFNATDASADGLSIDIQSSGSGENALLVTSNNGATTGLVVRGDGSVGVGGNFVGAGTGTFQGASLTVGTASQAGTLALFDGSSHTGSIQTAALAQNTVYTLPDPGGASADICLSTGNCVGSGGGAPNNAEYLLASLNGTLSNERALAAGSNISFTDGGANGSFTVATVQNPAFTTSVTTPILQNAGNLSITNSGAGNDITLTSQDLITLDAGAGGITLSDATTVSTTLGVGTAATANIVTIGSSAGQAEIFISGNNEANIAAEGSMYLGFDANNDCGICEFAIYNDGTTEVFGITGSNSRFRGSITSGTAALQGSLVLNDGNGETATISVGSGLAANTAIALPTAVGASDTFCLLTLGNCFGSGTGNNLQAAYNAGNAITTTDNRDIAFTLADTATDSDFTLNMQAIGSIFQIQDAGTSIATFDGNGGTFKFRPGADSTSAFNITTRATDGNLLTVDTANSRVGINLTGSVTPTLSGGGLEVNGAIRISGGTGNTDNFTTPGASGLGTKLNVPIYNIGNLGSAIAVGLDDGSHAVSSGIAVFDQRAGTDLRQAIGLFSPDESKILGFSWEGQDTNGYVKVGSGGTIGLRAGTTNSATFSSSAISLLQNTTASGTLAVNGNTTLGDASGDSVTITGTAIAIPNNLNFDTNTLYLDASGDNVAIGTVTPDGKLTVSQSSTGTTANDEKGLRVSVSNTGNVTSGTDNSYGGQIAITHTVSSGTAAINTYGLDIQATGSTAGTSTAYGLNVSVTGADTNYAAIFQGGAVGIGTATPTSGTTLDVNGNLRASGTLELGATATGAVSSSTSGWIYTGNGSGDFSSGNLILQSRPGGNRDIVFIAGSGNTKRLLIDGSTGNTILSGNLLPDGTGGNRTLGNTSVQFAGLYVNAGTSNGIQFGNSQQIGLAFDSGGDSRLEITGTNGSLFIEDRLSFGSQTLTITDDGNNTNDTLQMVATFVEVNVDETASGGAAPDLLLEENSTYAKHGQLLIITNTEVDGSEESFTLTEAANNLYLPGSSVTLGARDSITLIYDDVNSYWTTLSFSDN